MTQKTGIYINGHWQAGAQEIENRNPSDLSDLIGMYAQASADQLDEALDAARAAQPKWWAAGVQKRHDVLMAIGTELMARAEEIGYTLAREEDLAESVRPGIEIDVRREPIGVVAIISPWNFPIATPAWKIAPALAFGNAVVWKPANVTPASAVALTEIIAKQDIPAGLFNLVAGPGRAVGQRLVESPKVDAITFTGSVPVGRGIAATAIANMTKVQMEMGSKNPMLIMDDADLDMAVAHASNAAFGGTGQKCTAASRLIVHEAIHDVFVEKLVAAANGLKVGHALEAGTQLGPVVSQSQLDQNLDYIEAGKSEGAELLCGGTRLERATEGFYMAPAVFAGTRNDMRINREEMFAPITSVIKAGSYTEALSIANDTPFGLTAGIMTRSLARAAHFRANARAGCVMVNLPTAGTDYHVPFGGRGASSFGPREQGSYAAEFYTSVKTSYVSAGEVA
jgi:aldehyde dehydrogenase (NAD+)